MGLSPRSLGHALRLNIDAPRLRISRTHAGERALVFDSPAPRERPVRDAGFEELDPAPRAEPRRSRFIDDPNEVGWRHGLVRAAREGFEHFAPDEARAGELEAAFGPLERVRIPSDAGEVERPMLRLTPDVRRQVLGGRMRFATAEEAPGLRSALLDTIERGANQATPEQWRATIRNAQGVKREEIEWSGVEYWLDAQEGPVTRAALARFVRERVVRVEETVLGGESTVDPALQRELLPKIEERDRLTQRLTEIGQRIAADDPDFRSLLKEREALDETVRGLNEEIVALEHRIYATRQTNDTKWSQYTLPGGTAYRELLLRLPSDPKNIDELAAAEALRQQNLRWDALNERERENFRNAVRFRNRDAGFKSSHFDQPNILAHVRFNERTDSSGRRTLFIEEVQSDWHQAGRERGYTKGLDTTGWRAEQFGDDNRWSIINPSGEEVSIITVPGERATSQQALAVFADRVQRGTVPDAPFKNNAWASLAMKRMIRWAAENGFDQIAWTRGQHQIERFNLEKFVDDLEWRFEPRIEGEQGGSTRGTLTGRKDGANIINQVMDESELPGMIGKELAERLLSAPHGRIAQGRASRTLSGVDLRVGGEGMRAFYDRILPNIANDLGKKYGARVGETTVFANNEYTHDVASNLVRENPEEAAGELNPQTVHSLPITPELRRAALEGLPKFAADGAGGEIRGSNVADITREVREAWGETGPKMLEAGELVVVQSRNEIPRASLMGGSIPPGTAAVHVYGQTYFIAEAMRPSRVKSLMLHEIGVHHGLEAMIGKRRFQTLMKKVEARVDERMEAFLRGEVQEDDSWIVAHQMAERFSYHKDDLWEEVAAYAVEMAELEFRNFPEQRDRTLLQQIVDGVKRWATITLGIGDITGRDLHTLAAASLRRTARLAERNAQKPGRAMVWMPIRDVMKLAGDGPDGSSAQAGRASALEGEVLPPGRDLVAPARPDFQVTPEMKDELLRRGLPMLENAARTESANIQRLLDSADIKMDGDGYALVERDGRVISRHETRDEANRAWREYFDAREIAAHDPTRALPSTGDALDVANRPKLAAGEAQALLRQRLNFMQRAMGQGADYRRPGSARGPKEAGLGEMVAGNTAAVGAAASGGAVVAIEQGREERRAEYLRLEAEREKSEELQRERDAWRAEQERLREALASRDLSQLPDMPAGERDARKAYVNTQLVAWVQAMTGADPEYMRRMIARESAYTWDPAADNPRSNAHGLTQFIPSTWAGELRRVGGRYGLDLAGMSVKDILRSRPLQDLRGDARFAAAIAGEHTVENVRLLRAALGREDISRGEAYVAHFMGATRAVALLRDAEAGLSAAATIRKYSREAAANRHVFFDGERPLSAREIVRGIEREFGAEAIEISQPLERTADNSMPESDE